MADGKKTAFEPGFVSRVAAGVKYAFTGKTPAWFGPGDPMPPAVRDPEASGVTGRMLDYPTGFNLTSTPRAGEPVTFSQMRALADGLDLLRLVVETRKDQMAALDWQINARPEKTVGKKRLAELNDFFAIPDQEHTWDEWLRAILEDLLVIDAATIYVRKQTRGGPVYALEPVDGATIKRVLNPFGRTPEPPAPAYQQVLKGLPVIDYTRDELIYRPRNYRTHKVYGYSPVEQVIMTVNIALRRQIYQLQYYTEGNIPEALIGVPESWAPDQIRQFQEYWDYVNAGDTASRRHAKFVPGGLSITQTKESVLKDQYDEWLARVICFCFSLSPQAFVREMNRATSEQSDETSKEQGLEPLKKWVKNLVDTCLTKHLKAPDCELSWKEDQDIDPLVQAQVDQIYLTAGVKTVPEVRDELGLEPMKETEIPIAAAPDENPALPPPQAGPPPPGPEGEVPPTSPSTPLLKGSDKSQVTSDKHVPVRLDPIPLDRPVVERAAKALTNRINSFLKKLGKSLADQISASYESGGDFSLGKAVKKPPSGDLVDSLDFGDWGALFDVTAEYAAKVAIDSGMQALKQLKISEEGITKLVHDRAVEYAKERAAELVGKRYDKETGALVDNPNPKWAVDDATRDMLRGTVTKALETGPTVQDLRNEIIDSYAFSPERAEMIARTELAFAHSRGSVEGYKAAEGLGFHVMKEWLLSQDDYCDECQENADAGPIEMDEAFPSGDFEPPLHPNCRCAISPVVVEAPEDQTEGSWK